MGFYISDKQSPIKLGLSREGDDQAISMQWLYTAAYRCRVTAKRTSPNNYNIMAGVGFYGIRVTVCARGLRRAHLNIILFIISGYIIMPSINTSTISKMTKIPLYRRLERKGVSPKSFRNCSTTSFRSLRASLGKCGV